MKLTVKNLESQESTTTEFDLFSPEVMTDFALPPALDRWIQTNHRMAMPDYSTVVIESDTEEATFSFESKQELTLFFACLPPLELNKKRIVVVGKHRQYEKIEFPKMEVQEYVAQKDVFKEEERKKKRTPYYNRNRPF